MSQAEVKRAQRLVGLRGRALDGAKAVLAREVRDRAAAEAERDRAEARWREEAASLAQQEAADVEEWTRRHAYVRSLRARLEHAEAARVEALRREALALEALIAARVEVKKMEAWRDAKVAERDAEADKLAQERMDEVATRAGRSPSGRDAGEGR